jgi:hypothetical protein
MGTARLRRTGRDDNRHHDGKDRPGDRDCGSSNRRSSHRIPVSCFLGPAWEVTTRFVKDCSVREDLTTKIPATSELHVTQVCAGFSREPGVSVSRRVPTDYGWRGSATTSNGPESRNNGWQGPCFMTRPVFGARRPATSHRASHARSSIFV